MLKKSYSKTGKACRVTFQIPETVEAGKAALLGEFNSWDQAATPMKKLKKGGFSTTVSLDPGQEYRFRYLVDGERWINDEQPDSLVLNRFGSQDCVVTV